MDRIRIKGGQELRGTITISGAKNAALPLLILSLLTDQRLIIDNVPRLADVEYLIQILANHGVDVTVRGKRLNSGHNVPAQSLGMRARNIVDTTAPYEWVRKMRASFWVIGALLARCGKAEVSLPGGCAIGIRPIDFYLKGLTSLGAEISIESGYVKASAKGGLRGSNIDLPKPSVGATHVLMMAACLAKGTTVINNAAREPEVINVVDCLNSMGAKITGAGSGQLIITGVDRLNGGRCRVISDRIETGTYAIAVAMAGGDVILEGGNGDDLQKPVELLKAAGVDITAVDNGLRVKASTDRCRPVDMITAPFPGFPTDLQAQFMALMARAEGDTTITETIFDNRFMHVQELARMGARICLDGQKAVVTGVDTLTGTDVMATDLRASVCLVIAGLAAAGETTIHRIYHLDRGFERLESKLQQCGAIIQRLSE